MDYISCVSRPSGQGNLLSLCMECFDETGDGRHGAVSFGNDVGIFDCHFIFRHVRRISRGIGGTDWTELFRLYFCLLFRYRHDRNGTCCFIEIALFTLFVLRLSGRNRSGNRLYYTCICSGEMVSPSPGFCDRTCHHGIRLLCSYCGTGYAVPDFYGGISL